MIYTEEQLNYFRICYIVTTILTQALRSIFKKEWDRRYPSGEWNDTPKNGLDFYNMECSGSRKPNARLLATIKRGKSAEWDCTTLFSVLLYSNSISRGLSPMDCSPIDDLRQFRNEEFAHMPRGRLPETPFILAVRRVETAFQALGLSTVKIQEIRKQISFPTEELLKVQRSVDSLYQELCETNVKLQTSEDHRLFLEEQLRNDVSSFCILPPKPFHEIATRDFEVAKIMEQLEHLRKRNKNGLSFCHISGNPGSGKSQLARLVAEKFYKTVTKDHSYPSFVMTLKAESLKTLLESYILLARQIKCIEYAVMPIIGSTEMQVEEKVKNLKDLIAPKIELYGSWLLLVDNVSNVSDIHDFLPQPGNEQWTKGQLLITTQNTSFIPSNNSFVSHISVSEGMVPTDARCFLANISGITEQGQEDKVAKELDYQPLALASAAVYVKKIRESVDREFGWNEYLEKLKRGMRAITEKELAQTNSSYSKSMTAATKLAIERAMNRNSVVKSAFTFLSLVAPQPLHLDIVTNYVLIEEKHLDKEEVALQIQGYSLLMREERRNGVFISVHQVVHDVMKSLIKEFCQPNRHVKVVALTSFNQFIETNLTDTWYKEDCVADSKHLIPHLNALALEIGDVFHDSDALNSLSKLGTICRNHSELPEAKAFYDTALKLIERDETCTDVDVADICSQLGIVLWQMGDLKQAREHFTRALDITLKELGPEHVHVACNYHLLGIVHRALGDLLQAKTYHEQALEICLRKLGPENVGMANTYHHLGNAHFELSNLKEAKEHYDRALEIQLRNVGPDHVYTAFSYCSLGDVQRELGSLVKAKEHYERSLGIRLEKLGPEHVEVAISHNNLGIIHRYMGDLQKAKKHHELALDIERKKRGPDHVYVANTYYHLGNVQYDLRNLREAKMHYKRALNTQLEKLGPDHVNVAFSYCSLGDVERQMGDVRKAKKYYETALDIKLKKLGPEHVHVACTYHLLGMVQRTLGDLQKAKEHYDLALDIRLNKLGPDHVNVAYTHNELGNVLRVLGDLQQAKVHFKRALDIELKRSGPEHVDVARTYHKLAMVHRALGDLPQAKKYHVHASNIRLKNFGPEHIEMANSYHHLGNVEYELKNLQEAEKLYKRSLDIQQKNLGSEHLYVSFSYVGLGNVQRTLGNLERAKEFYELALANRRKNLGPKHVDVARIYSNQGHLQCDLGDLQKAKNLYQRALEILLQVLGPRHVEVNNLRSLLSNVERDLFGLHYDEERYGHAVYTEIRNPRLERFICEVDDFDFEVSSVYRDDDYAKCCIIS